MKKLKIKVKAKKNSYLKNKSKGFKSTSQGPRLLKNTKQHLKEDQNPSAKGQVENRDSKQPRHLAADRPLRESDTNPPELLAPAGSKASWAAAVEAGADAVYLGLNDFSARSYAENFSLTELSALIEESHKVGVKVYLAMNSLIKESELEQVWRLLGTAASLKPDAFIIQDLGLASLAATYYPQIPRHASTLTAVHSLPALVVLQQAAFSRAVLARELAFDEIKALSTHSPIDVEIFIHGALCFSFSGLCLMSSFLGGRSALRGGCTQPCRRNYSRSGRMGSFFSASDLSTAPYFKQLRDLPISTFKIEGRMKGPDYVSRVVKAYRMLLDAPSSDWPYALVEAENILAKVPSRRTCGGPLAADVEGALAPLGSTTSGLKLGWLDFKENHGLISLENDIEVNDRLRLQAKAGGESAAFNLKSIFLCSEGALRSRQALDSQTSRLGSECKASPPLVKSAKIKGHLNKFSTEPEFKLPLQKGDEVAPQRVETAKKGDQVILKAPNLPMESGFLFKVSSGNEEKSFLASPLIKNIRERAKRVKLPAPQKMPPELKIKSFSKMKALELSRLGYWIFLEKAEDMRELNGFECKKIILPITASNLRHIKNNRRKIKNELSKIVWSFPPLLFHQRQSILMKEAKSLIESGSQEFIVSNIGHINILKRAAKDCPIKIWGDHRLGVLNHLHEKTLLKLGLYGLTFSVEADKETYEALWKTETYGQRLLYFYGRPALFTARYPLDQRKAAIISPKGEKFYLGLEGEESIVYSEKAIFMHQFLKMPPLNGAAGLIIDLRYENKVADKLKELKRAISAGRSGQASSFNFRRSLS